MAAPLPWSAGDPGWHTPAWAAACAFPGHFHCEVAFLAEEEARGGAARAQAALPSGAVRAAPSRPLLFSMKSFVSSQSLAIATSGDTSLSRLTALLLHTLVSAR